MIETLSNFDHNLFLALNGMHSEGMDALMWWVADRFIWIPLYALVGFFLYKKFGSQSVFMMLFCILLIVISDQGSVLIKNMVQRPRPCHNESLSFMVHTVNNKCGGQFGFVSSHAANTMAFFTFILLLTRNHFRWITATLAMWVILIGYCRIYLGVHFPADVMGGWMVGICSALITYLIYRLVFESPQNHHP